MFWFDHTSLSSRISFSLCTSGHPTHQCPLLQLVSNIIHLSSFLINSFFSLLPIFLESDQDTICKMMCDRRWKSEIALPSSFLMLSGFLCLKERYIWKDHDGSWQPWACILHVGGSICELNVHLWANCAIKGVTQSSEWLGLLFSLGSMLDFV